MSRTRALTALAVLLAAACAPKLTPQQEWVMTNFEACKSETGAHNAHLARVAPDGSFEVTVSQTQTDYNRIIACMNAKPR